MDTGQWVVIILSVIIGGWYIGGYLVNRKLTKAVVRWLHSGLEGLGGFKKVEKLGTFAPGAKLLAPKAVKPFRRVETAFILESRENLPFWIFYHLRGKRDELLFKGFLNRSPVFEVEVARTGDRTFQGWISEPDNRHLKKVPSPSGFEIYLRAANQERFMDGLHSFLASYGVGIHRISIRPKSPHLSVKADLTPLLGVSPKEFFGTLKELADARS